MREEYGDTHTHISTHPLNNITIIIYSYDIYLIHYKYIICVFYTYIYSLWKGKKRETTATAPINSAPSFDSFLHSFQGRRRIPISLPSVPLVLPPVLSSSPLLPHSLAFVHHELLSFLFFSSTGIFSLSSASPWPPSLSLSLSPSPSGLLCFLRTHNENQIVLRELRLSDLLLQRRSSICIHIDVVIIHRS